MSDRLMCHRCDAPADGEFCPRCGTGAYVALPPSVVTAGCHAPGCSTSISGLPPLPLYCSEHRVPAPGSASPAEPFGEQCPHGYTEPMRWRCGECRASIAPGSASPPARGADVQPVWGDPPSTGPLPLIPAEWDPEPERSVLTECVHACRRGECEVCGLYDRLASAEAERDEYKRLMFESDERADQRLKQVQAAEARAEQAERWRVEVAEGLGFLNRAEGQDGYEVAEPGVIVEAFRRAEARAEAAEAHAAKAEADMRNAREIAAEHIAAESKERRRAEAAERARDEAREVARAWKGAAEDYAAARAELSAERAALSALREGVRGLAEGARKLPGCNGRWIEARDLRTLVADSAAEDAARALLGGGDAQKENER